MRTKLQFFKHINSTGSGIIAKNIKNTPQLVNITAFLNQNDQQFPRYSSRWLPFSHIISSTFMLTILCYAMETSSEAPVEDLSEDDNKKQVQNNLSDTTNNPYFILSVDGGGIRGIIPLVFLQKIEQFIKEELAYNGVDSSTYKISDDIDLLAGTSTGGLIALGLSSGLTLDQIRNLYENKKNAKELFIQKNIQIKINGNRHIGFHLQQH